MYQSSHGVILRGVYNYCSTAIRRRSTVN